MSQTARIAARDAAQRPPEAALTAKAIAQKPVREAMAHLAALPHHEQSNVLTELAKGHGMGGHQLAQLILNLPMIVYTMPAELAGT